MKLSVCILVCLYSFSAEGLYCFDYNKWPWNLQTSLSQFHPKFTFFEHMFSPFGLDLHLRRSSDVSGLPFVSLTGVRCPRETKRGSCPNPWGTYSLSSPGPGTYEVGKASSWQRTLICLLTAGSAWVQAGLPAPRLAHVHWAVFDLRSLSPMMMMMMNDLSGLSWATTGLMEMDVHSEDEFFFNPSVSRTFFGSGSVQQQWAGRVWRQEVGGLAIVSAQGLCQPRSTFTWLAL